MKKVFLFLLLNLSFNVLGMEEKHKAPHENPSAFNDDLARTLARFFKLEGQLPRYPWDYGVLLYCIEEVLANTEFYDPKIYKTDDSTKETARLIDCSLNVMVMALRSHLKDCNRSLAKSYPNVLKNISLNPNEQSPYPLIEKGLTVYKANILEGFSLQDSEKKE